MLTEKLLTYILKTLEKSEEEVINNIQKLKEARDEIVNFTSSSDPNLYQGSLVLDTKDQELGFVIGPLDVWGRNNHPSLNQRIITGRRSINNTYLLVTIPNNKENSEGGSKIYYSQPQLNNLNSQFRIRYVNKANILPIEVEPERRSLDDLGKFCNEQCIMECSESCVLWKYKKKR